ncbi:MAG: ABC transporter permease [Acidimicrobiales bacterium]
MSTLGLRRLALAIAAPALAIVFALVISSVVLLAVGSNPIDTYREMFLHSLKLETQIDILNRATPLFLAGVAAAIAFRMNLFNIGVEGQYVLAAFLTAVVGAKLDLPAPLHVFMIILVAVLVGAAWSGFAGLMFVTREVNIVISTIMLNALAVLGIVAALFPVFLDETDAATAGTKAIASSGQLPNMNGIIELVTREIGKGRELTSVLLIAIAVGIVFQIVVDRTRFGYDLRASGLNPFAARAAGVPPKRMVMIAMIASGAIAGLVGLPQILSDNHAFDSGFVFGLGFAGIAIALLGRNGAAGMAVAALVFGFLDSTAGILQLRGVASPAIVIIMQGTVLLAAVVAYEVVNRIKLQDEIRRASEISGVTA